MASFAELVELNKKGDLGKLLIQNFGGEIGYVQDVADREFMIEYPSVAEMPSAESVRDLVRKHYEVLGYSADIKATQGVIVDGMIFHETLKETKFISVTISMRYPISGNDTVRKHARISTQIVE